MMNRVLCYFFCFLFTLQVGAQTVLTLQQCIDTALANNMLVQQVDLQKQAGKIALNQARSNLLPNMNAEVNHRSNAGRSIDPSTNSYINQNANTANYLVYSNVTIFNGFSLRNSIRQSSFAYESLTMTYQQSKDRLVLDVILAYLDVLNGEDQVKLANRRTENSRQTFERLQVLNNKGAIRPSDLSDLKGQLLTDQLNILQTKNQLETFKINLSVLMNVPYNPDLLLERINVEEFLSAYTLKAGDVYQNSLSQFARIKAAELNTKSFEYQAKAARGQLYPTIGVGALINTNYSSFAQNAAGKIPYGNQLKNNRYTSLGIGVTIPIFNRSFARNRIKLAEINLEDAELREKNVKRELQQQVDLAYLDMSNARNRYQLYIEQVNAYEESFKAAEVRFQSGVGTSIDYLVAKDRFEQANINMLSSKYDFVLRKRILDYYNGKTN